MKKAFALMLVAMMVLGACQYNTPVFVTVNSNETGFHVHYVDGKVVDSSGKPVTAGKFMTIDYLKDVEVASTRVQLSKIKQKHGYMFYSFKYITTDGVLIVNNSPASVYFKAGEIAIASKDEVGFSLPIRITASVPKVNSALYLVNFPPTNDTNVETDNKKMVKNQVYAKPLNSVLEDTVRTFIISRTAFYFKQLSFEKCRSEALSVYAKVEKETRDFCNTYGINLVTFACEGIVPDDASVQESLDAIGKKDILLSKAQMDKELKTIENQKNEATAESNAKQEKAKADASAYAANASIRERARADADAARANAATLDIQARLTELRIREKQADALLEFAKNPSKLPDVVNTEGLKLYGLDKLIPTVKE